MLVIASKVFIMSHQQTQVVENEVGELSFGTLRKCAHEAFSEAALSVKHEPTGVL